MCVSKYREQRVALVATIQVSKKQSIRFASTHFGHCILEQKAAADMLGEKLKTDEPVILVGDFNSKMIHKDGSTGELKKKFDEFGFMEAQTDPEQKLPQAVKKRIDWILHSKCWQPTAFNQNEKTVSDHRAVFATLNLLEACRSK